MSMIFEYEGRAGDSNTDVLVIAQKDVCAELRKGAPANVAFLHFGKLRGQDRFKDVPSLIIIGRAAPSHETLELMTEALYWDDPEVAEFQYADDWPKGEKAITMADGTARRINGDRHPDALVEELRVQIVDNELNQAVGRARLVQRGATNPCDVTLFGQIATRTPAHHIINFDATDRDLAGLQLATGLVYRRGATIARKWPAHIPTEERRQKRAAADAWAQVAGTFVKSGLTSKYIYI